MRCVATNLSVIAQRLNRPQRPPSLSGPNRDETALRDLCQKCEQIAQEMLAHLKKFKIERKKSAWKSFRIALNATWDQKELDSLIQRLQLLKKSVESWFLVDMTCAMLYSDWYLAID